MHRISMTHAANSAGHMRIAQEDKSGCNNLLAIVAMRRKYWVAPPHSAVVAPIETLNARSSRRVFFQRGRFYVLASDVDLCSHDQADVANGE